MKKYLPLILSAGTTLLASIMLKNANSIGSVAMWSIFLVWDILLPRESCKELNND